MILFYYLSRIILFSRFFVIDCNSYQRTLIINDCKSYQKSYQRTLIINNYMNRHQLSDDLFGQVHQLITPSQFSQQYIRDTLDGSMESLNTFKVGDGILRRKPSRDTLLSKKIDVNENCSTHQKVREIMMNSHKINRTVNVGLQLKRLEKNLIAAKVGPNKFQNEGRQRKVMMRLQGQKQNISVESMKVTSQQLSKFEQKDEQLKEVLLALQRFYEKQQEQNLKLQAQISSLNMQLNMDEQCISSQQQQIEQMKQKLTAIRRQNQLEQVALLSRRVRNDYTSDKR